MSLTAKFASSAVAAIACCLMLAGAAAVRAQAQPIANGHDAAPVQQGGPADALVGVLSAACHGNETEFADYFTNDNATAFRALPKDQRTQLLRRFSLLDEPGKPLLSADERNHNVLRCSTPSTGVEFRFGDARVQENLAFIPVTVVNGAPAQFGLVRTSGGWRIISLGLVMLDIPELSQQWARGDLEERENAIVVAMQGFTEAINRYKTAFGKLPESLAQLGPADAGQISPEQASMVSKELAAGAAGGYHFHYRVVSSADPKNQTFELGATPDEYGKTGRRSFFQDGAGRIHAANKHGVEATADDPALDTDNATNTQ